MGADPADPTYQAGVGGTVLAFLAGLLHRPNPEPAEEKKFWGRGTAVMRPSPAGSTSLRLHKLPRTDPIYLSYEGWNADRGTSVLLSRLATALTRVASRTHAASKGRSPGSFLDVLLPTFVKDGFDRIDFHEHGALGSPREYLSSWSPDIVLTWIARIRGPLSIGLDGICYKMFSSLSKFNLLSR